MRQPHLPYSVLKHFFQYHTPVPSGTFGCCARTGRTQFGWRAKPARTWCGHCARTVRKLLRNHAWKLCCCECASRSVIRAVVVWAVALPLQLQLSVELRGWHHFCSCYVNNPYPRATRRHLSQPKSCLNLNPKRNPISIGSHIHLYSSAKAIPPKKNRLPLTSWLCRLFGKGIEGGS